MWCLVSQPNSVVIEVEVDQRAIGQECLDKVCRKLSIIEVDYFGLQYVSNKGENLWLNMRNEIRRQMSGIPPYRFQIKVKFFVPPHLLLQECTRHLFYLHVKQNLIEKKLMCTTDQLAPFLGLIAQAEIGDCIWSSCKSYNYSILFPDYDVECLHMTAEQHEKLKGINQESAEYLLLKKVSELEEIGMEFFVAKSGSGSTVQFGVGTQGIYLYDSSHSLISKIKYSQIRLATSTGKCFFLHYADGDNEDPALVKMKAFKLESTKSANGLYRSLTEKHAFYSCETVRDAVTSQFIRDLKGIIIALFNENTPMGKKYVFDVQRTCREAYDSARRTLHHMNVDTPENLMEDESASHFENKENCDNLQCKILRQKLASLQDHFLCRICMDSQINTTFLPCGHVLCCQQCAEICNLCPLCRSNVQQSQFIYLPVSELLPK